MICPGAVRPLPVPGPEPPFVFDTPGPLPDGEPVGDPVGLAPVLRVTEPVPEPEFAFPNPSIITPPPDGVFLFPLVRATATFEVPAGDDGAGTGTGAELVA